MEIKLPFSFQKLLMKFDNTSLSNFLMGKNTFISRAKNWETFSILEKTRH